MAGPQSKDKEALDSLVMGKGKYPPIQIYGVINENITAFSLKILRPY